MGAYFEEIPESLIPWILDQKVIWIGSAPLSGEGHVNVSPKGGGYFGVSSRRQFWYQDLTGLSGRFYSSRVHFLTLTQAPAMRPYPTSGNQEMPV